MRLSRSRLSSALIIAAMLVLGASRQASAAAIGAFSYDVDADFGPVFTIENFFDSPGTFSAIVIHLLSGGTDTADLTTDNVAAGNLIQAVVDPAVTFDSAFMTLAFSEPGSTAVDSLTGLIFDPLTFTGNTATTAINFTPEFSQSVPEPSTLFLVTAGLGAALVHRRRGRPRPS